MEKLMRVYRWNLINYRVCSEYNTFSYSLVYDGKTSEFVCVWKRVWMPKLFWWNAYQIIYLSQINYWGFSLYFSSVIYVYVYQSSIKYFDFWWFCGVWQHKHRGCALHWWVSGKIFGLHNMLCFVLKYG